MLIWWSVTWNISDPKTVYFNHRPEQSSWILWIHCIWAATSDYIWYVCGLIYHLFVLKISESSEKSPTQVHSVFNSWKLKNIQFTMIWNREKQHRLPNQLTFYFLLLDKSVNQLIISALDSAELGPLSKSFFSAQVVQLFYSRWRHNHRTYHTYN